MKKLIIILCVIVSCSTYANADIYGPMGIRVKGTPEIVWDGTAQYSGTLNCPGNLGTCFTGYRNLGDPTWHIRITGMEGEYIIGAASAGTMDDTGVTDEEGNAIFDLTEPIEITEE